jgi:hypothetical protein
MLENFKIIDVEMKTKIIKKTRKKDQNSRKGLWLHYKYNYFSFHTVWIQTPITKNIYAF